MVTVVVKGQPDNERTYTNLYRVVKNRDRKSERSKSTVKNRNTYIAPDCEVSMDMLDVTIPKMLRAIVSLSVRQYQTTQTLQKQ